MGGKPQALEKRDDIAAAFELHIEQGQVLEAGGIAVGIVSGIVGIIRLEVVLHGQANHAGTTPMPLRHDALTAAAEIILAAETLAQEMAARGEGYVVATCGQIFATPNASNVIAGETRLVFDIRSDQRALMLHYLEQLQTQAEGIAARGNHRPLGAADRYRAGTGRYGADGAFTGGGRSGGRQPDDAAQRRRT